MWYIMDGPAQHFAGDRSSVVAHDCSQLTRQAGSPVTMALPQPSGERRVHTSSEMPGHSAAASAILARAAALAAASMSVCGALTTFACNLSATGRTATPALQGHRHQHHGHPASDAPSEGTGIVTDCSAGTVIGQLFHASLQGNSSSRAGKAAGDGANGQDRESGDGRTAAATGCEG